MAFERKLDATKTVSYSALLKKDKAPQKFIPNTSLDLRQNHELKNWWNCSFSANSASKSMKYGYVDLYYFCKKTCTRKIFTFLCGCAFHCMKNFSFSQQSSYRDLLKTEKMDIKVLLRNFYINSKDFTLRKGIRALKL